MAGSTRAPGAPGVSVPPRYARPHLHRACVDHVMKRFFLKRLHGKPTIRSTVPLLSRQTQGRPLSKIVAANRRPFRYLAHVLGWMACRYGGVSRAPRRGRDDDGKWHDRGSAACHEALASDCAEGGGWNGRTIRRPTGVWHRPDEHAGSDPPRWPRFDVRSGGHACWPGPA